MSIVAWWFLKDMRELGVLPRIEKYTVNPLFFINWSIPCIWWCNSWLGPGLISSSFIFGRRIFLSSFLFSFWWLRAHLSQSNPLLKLSDLMALSRCLNSIRIQRFLVVRAITTLLSLSTEEMLANCNRSCCIADHPLIISWIWIYVYIQKLPCACERICLRTHHRYMQRNWEPAKGQKYSV